MIEKYIEIKLASRRVNEYTWPSSLTHRVAPEIVHHLSGEPKKKGGREGGREGMNPSLKFNNGACK